MPDTWAAGRLLPGYRPRVLFGHMYEDHGAELATFPPASRVLTVASAGDTAAALARAGHHVTAIDINPAQLRYAQQRLAGHPPATGTAERILTTGRLAAATLLPAWRPGALRRFLTLADPDAQARWWRTKLDRPALRTLLALALRPTGPLGAMLRPGPRSVLHHHLDTLLLRRIGAGLARYPNADNPWAWRLLLGHDPPDNPPHRQPTPPVRWVHGDVLTHLHRTPAGWYGAATLSNILDGAPPGAAPHLAAALRHAVHGPVLLRTLGHRPPLPGQPIPERALLWGAAILLDL
jgi:hypothetical protein